MTCPKFCWPRGARRRNWITRVYLGTLNWLKPLATPRRTSPVIPRWGVFDGDRNSGGVVMRRGGGGARGEGQQGVMVIWLIRPNWIRICPLSGVLEVNVKGLECRYNGDVDQLLFCSLARPPRSNVLQAAYFECPRCQQVINAAHGRVL